jgi:hypothetical protein
MGSLTVYLQEEFARKCPLGWNCRTEVRLLSPELESFLGYASRVDVLLERDVPEKRLWIEFEVSRADPVANHAKFATAHVFRPQSPTDIFVAMVSSHITRGRRNLASVTIALMRLIGMSAFQTVLLPGLSPAEVKQLNHLSKPEIKSANLPVDQDIERAMAVTESLGSMSATDVYFAGDLLLVFLNLRRWNSVLGTEVGKKAWGRRTVTYFVYEAESGLFAPTKYCAYSLIPSAASAGTGTASLGIMTVDGYTMLNDGTHALDGHAAVRHLVDRLGMVLRKGSEDLAMLASFDRWLEGFSGSIHVHPAGPVFLVPPAWFA